jgi:hypothetical protein
MIGIFGEDKRKSGSHQKRELDVEIHIPDRRIGKVFSIDISYGGLRVAGIGLYLNIGEKVNFSVAMMGDKYEGEGLVSRKDRPREIRRIGGRLGNVFFVKVDDQKFREFVENKCNIRPQTSHEKTPIACIG